jgi:aminoglycoside phosphotransferase (APT) family kinase protein
MVEIDNIESKTSERRYPTVAVETMKLGKPPHRVPWHDDYPLDPVEVAAILAADLPELRVAQVTALGAGWDFSTYLVNDQWVFRFPKRRQSALQLAREKSLLDALADALRDDPIAIPCYRFHVRKPATFALPYVGYPMLRGEALSNSSTDAVDRRDVGRQLGRFLKRLNGAAPSRAPRIYHDELPGHIVDFRRELDEVAAALPPHLAAACRTLLGKAPAPYRGPPLFQHADLGAEHILVDPAGGRIIGIIDWGDAGWGNPVADVVGLWAWGGDAAVIAAQSTWQRVLAPEDWARLRFWGASYAIGNAYFGYKDGRDALLAVALGWLERMHQSGQLSDPGTTDA